MELINGTGNYSDWFLRRLVEWVAYSLDVNPSEIERAQFRRSGNAYVGTGRGVNLLVTLPGKTVNVRFPLPIPNRNHAVSTGSAWTEIEMLIGIVAIELQYMRKAPKRNPGWEHVRWASTAARRLLDTFRNTNPDEVIEAWRQEPERRVSEHGLTPNEIKLRNAQDNLKMWMQRAAVAERKIARYRREIKSYGQKVKRAIAAAGGTHYDAEPSGRDGDSIPGIGRGPVDADSGGQAVRGDVGDEDAGIRGIPRGAPDGPRGHSDGIPDE